VVPDHDCLTVPVNVKVDKFVDIANEMLKKIGKSDGGFVAKPTDPLNCKQLTSLGLKLVSPKILHVTKRSEGAFQFEFEDQVNQKGVIVRNRVNTFVRESKDYEKMLLNPAEGKDSFWTWVLDNYEDFAQIEPKVKPPKYVVDLDDTLFGPEDSNNPW
jgi:hypothetical protein